MNIKEAKEHFMNNKKETQIFIDCLKNDINKKEISTNKVLVAEYKLAVKDKTMQEKNYMLNLLEKWMNE